MIIWNAETLVTSASPTKSENGTNADADGNTQNALAPANEETASQKAAEDAVVASNEAQGVEADVGTPKLRPGAVVKRREAPSTPSPETVVAEDKPAKPKPKTKTTSGFFASLFKPSRPRAEVAPSRTRVKKRRVKRRLPASLRADNGDLPGVRTRGLFGLDDHEEEDLDRPVKLASVSNLARRGHHGLLIQRPGIRVDCFPPELVRLLKKVERQFGRTPIVTSGFRSRKHNRRIRGARNSTHTRCMAADIQVKGVSKWQVAKYLRSLPGRGGVGTYCHTRSVHIDIGKKRDWNRRCRRKRRRT